MRRFRVADGSLWDAVVGRESWGNLYALFIPAGSGRTEPMRRALLASAGYDEGMRELDLLQEDALLALFESAEITPQDGT